MAHSTINGRLDLFKGNELSFTNISEELEGLKEAYKKTYTLAPEEYKNLYMMEDGEIRLVYLEATKDVYVDAHGFDAYHNYGKVSIATDGVVRNISHLSEFNAHITLGKSELLMISSQAHTNNPIGVTALANDLMLTITSGELAGAESDIDYYTFKDPDLDGNVTLTNDTSSFPYPNQTITATGTPFALTDVGRVL